MQLVELLTVLSLAPAILIMMTSFTWIVIVMGLPARPLGTQQLPPNQVLGRPVALHDLPGDAPDLDNG